MAAGEYVSVKSQAESALAEIESERLELLHRPEAELDELIESYVSRGVPRPLATDFATAISADFELALDIHTRDEIGINPNDLPSAWVAAFSSFGSFAVGAVIFQPVSVQLQSFMGLASMVQLLSFGDQFLW